MKRPRTVRTKLLLRGLCFFLLANAAAHAQEWKHSIGANVDIVSGSQIFISPFSRDPFLRGSTTQIGAFVNPRITYGYSFSPTAQIQGSFEYLRSEEKETDNYGTEYVDGFRLYAVEATGIFYLPVSGKRFLIFIGGGAGLYWGSRTFSIAGLSSNSSEPRASFGIVTVFGLEYVILERLSARAELRFRDPQIGAENSFDRTSVTSGGITYLLDPQPFASRINPNGNVYSAGLTFRF
jgi:opacity protein-like surface antigen